MNIDHIKPLLPHDAVFLPTDKGMYIRRNERVLALNGKTIYAAFLRLAPLLDGQHTLGALCAGIPAENAAALRRLLTSLIDKKVLIARSDDDRMLLTPQEHACYASQLAFLEHLIEQPCAALQRLRGARVYLDGDGMACQAAGQTLLRNGVGQLYLAAGIDDELAAVLQATAATLRGEGVSVSVSPLKEDFAAVQARHAFDHAVYVSDRPAFDTLAELTRLCGLHGTTLFPAVLIDGAARIGPLPTAQGAGCWHCAFLRLLDQLPAPLAAQLWRHRALGLPYLAEMQHSGAPLLQIMGSGVAFRLFQHVCGIAGDGDERTHAVESISGMTLEGRTGMVLAHPDCTLGAHAHMPTTATPAGGPPDAERMLVANDFGLFAAYDDDTLKQVPVFQSRLRRNGDTARRASLPGNSMASNAQARRQALLAGALDYALARAPGGDMLLSSAQAARSGAEVIDPAAVMSTVGLADPARYVSSWLRAIGDGDGRDYLLSGDDVFGAGIPGQPERQMPGSGAGAGFGLDEARRAAMLSLLTRQGLQAVVDGDIVPAVSDPAHWAPESAAYFGLLRQSAPDSAAWTFTFAHATVVVIALDAVDAVDAGAQRVVVGAGTAFEEASRQALTEALAVSAGGASAYGWADFLPPALGYGPFMTPPPYVCASAHMALADLAGADAGSVAIVYCDITPADLAQAGIAVVKAVLVRRAGTASTVDRVAECAA